MEPADQNSSIPFIQLVRNPNSLMHDLYVVAYETGSETIKVFNNLGRQLLANSLSASGLTWEDFENNKLKKLIHSWDWPSRE
jgi:hypothetical protein